MSHFDQNEPSPHLGSYESNSWALANMYDYAKLERDKDSQDTLQKWIHAHFVKYKEGCDYSLETGHFMAICTSWASLVSKVLDRAEFDDWATKFFRDIGLPQPVKNPINWHHRGLNFSRAWGLWELYATTGNVSYIEAFVAHFEETYTDTSQWRGSYVGVAHWVPQFGMFALQPLFGEKGR